CFIPYMGLTMAVVGGFAALLKHSKSNFLRALKSKLGWTLFILLLAANAWGVHERNKVWRDDLSLWKDVSEKSPKNGRGYMNYGLALMSRGQFDLAEVNFLRAAQLTPDYALVFVNLGILKQATAQYEDAEKYFDIALRTSTVDHQAHYYYAKYLIQVERLTE